MDLYTDYDLSEEEDCDVEDLDDTFLQDEHTDSEDEDTGSDSFISSNDDYDMQCDEDYEESSSEMQSYYSSSTDVDQVYHVCLKFY